ncbi:scavenger receptor cysteine-rich type 1 protein M130-like [Protopterus annectens]|uniref:scavenger receptor cysteine-rich type 1 protein M130-like n=1 Tax=Protopterus annectens TaxID=7888 RepID=UPI001CF9F97A|nr:scavenger receptor cysteine-rich type 1 protein M130-like [Protopterus annectens]
MSPLFEKTQKGKQRIKAIEDQPCSSYIVLNLDDSWILLHEEKLTMDIAKVACRMLECSEPKSIVSMPKHRQREERFFNGEIKCNESESQLTFCDLFHGSDNFTTDGHAGMVTCTGSKGYRLVNGNNACSGRVEIQYDGKWGSLCSLEWDMADANVLCNQMNCGYAMNISAEDNVENGGNEIWRDSFHCNGTESHLKFCYSLSFGSPTCPTGQVASVICSDENGRLRLMNGGSPCDGLVEIYYNGTWGRVQDELWNMTDANVVCRQLRCGTAMKAYSSVSNNTKESVWLRSVQCQGNESRLLDCTLNISYIQQPEIDVFPQYASVLCKEHMQLRIADAKGQCAGRVEVYYNGTWGTVCDDWWDLAAANVVCQQLKCGHAITASTSAAFGKGSGPIWLDDFICSGSESVLWQCQFLRWGKHNCNHKEDAGVVCSGSKGYRLVNGSNACSGRVEIQYDAEWGSLCSLEWDMADANVLCNQMSCGYAVNIYAEDYVENGRNKIWRDSFRCNGTESHLKFCRSHSFGNPTCPTGQVASVICSDLNGRLRLMNGGSPCDGLVEIYYNGTWGRVQDELWNMADANVVCRQLRCGTAVNAYKNISRNINESVWLRSVQCQGNESKLLDCTLNISYIQQPEIAVVSQYAYVLCTDHMQLRLADAGGGCAGRVEVYYNGTWGTVCNDWWDLADANVVCQQLKCGHAISINNSAVFGKGSGPIWLGDLMCSGSEAVLWQCQSLGWGRHNCNRMEDAGVVCSEFKQLRLADGDHHCKGRLDVFHNGTWGTVCSNGLNSGSTTLSLVCHLLGCGMSGRLYDTPTFKKSLTDKSIDRIKCQSYHKSLWECSSSPWFDKPCTTEEETHLTCLEVHEKPNGMLSHLSCVNKSLGMECTDT